MKWFMLVALIAGAWGCSSSDSAAFDPERPWRQPGDVIDSILPMEEYERRFREGLPEVTAFSGGAADREALVRQFLDAVSRRDSVALGDMAVNRAEFAWLVFPHHLYRNPPYELDPGIFWMQVQANSAKGQARVLERLGGVPLTFRGLTCERDTLQSLSPDVQMWSQCQVEYATPDSTLRRRLFSSITAVGGSMKFLGYANDF